MKLGVNSGERDRDGIRTQGREREFNQNTFTHVWNFKRGKNLKIYSTWVSGIFSYRTLSK